MLSPNYVLIIHNREISDFCSEVSRYFRQTNTDVPPHLDFISLLIIIYSGVLEADFLALLLLCCGYQAVVHGHRGWLPRDRHAE